MSFLDFRDVRNHGKEDGKIASSREATNERDNDEMVRICGHGANHGSHEDDRSRIEDHWPSSIAIREDAKGDQKEDAHRTSQGIDQIHLEDAGSEVEGKENGNRVAQRPETVL